MTHFIVSEGYDSLLQETHILSLPKGGIEKRYLTIQCVDNAVDKGR